MPRCQVAPCLPLLPPSAPSVVKSAPMDHRRARLSSHTRLPPLHFSFPMSYYQRRRAPQLPACQPCGFLTARCGKGAELKGDRFAPRYSIPTHARAQAAPHARHAKEPKARQYGRARRSQARTGDTTGRERKKPPGKLLHRRPPNPESAEDHPHSHASRRDPKSPARPTVRMPPPPGVNPIAARSTPPVRPARSQERGRPSVPPGPTPRRLSALPLKTIPLHATQVGPQSQLRRFSTPSRPQRGQGLSPRVQPSPRPSGRSATLGWTQPQKA